MLLGWSDPVGLMALSPEDYEIAFQIIDKASKMDGERRQAELKALAESIGNHVGGIVSRQITALAKALR